MSKAIMLSIQPKWCEKIASGKKTVEVRKTRPKMETPFKCYIYCTTDKWLHLVQMPDKEYRIYNGREYGRYDKNLTFQGEGNGKIIGEFVCDSITYERYNRDGYGLKNEKEILKNSCLTEKELYHYLQGRYPYCWHISDLVIYDKPRELSEFRKGDACEWCSEDVCEYYGFNYTDGETCAVGYRKPLKRPPQSWCYVEDGGTE